MTFDLGFTPYGMVLRRIWSSRGKTPRHFRHFSATQTLQPPSEFTPIAETRTGWPPKRISVSVFRAIWNGAIIFTRDYQG